MGRSRAHPREGGSAEPRTLGPVTDRLGRLLLVTLEAARIDGDLARTRRAALVAELVARHRRCRAWHGARQGYDLHLTRYDARGWRATFYTTGMEHSITSATASEWEPTPWRAVQAVARDALRKASRDG